MTRPADVNERPLTTTAITNNNNTNRVKVSVINSE